MSYGLLLGGGSALGAAQVEILERLYESIGLPRLLAGVSIGANNLVPMAQDDPYRLRQIWQTIDGVGSFMTPNVLQAHKGLHDLDPLRAMLLQEVQRKQWLVESHVGVVDLETARYKSIRIDDLGYRQQTNAILASSSQPGIMEYVELGLLGDHVTVDGGVIHVLPHFTPQDLEDRGIREVHAVFCSPLGKRAKVGKKKVDNLVEVLSRTLSILMHQVVANDYRRLKRWAASGLDVWVYSPDENGDPFDADAETIEWRINTVGPAMWQSRRKL